MTKPRFSLALGLALSLAASPAAAVALPGPSVAGAGATIVRALGQVVPDVLPLLQEQGGGRDTGNTGNTGNTGEPATTTVERTTTTTTTTFLGVNPMWLMLGVVFLLLIAVLVGLAARGGSSGGATIVKG